MDSSAREALLEEVVVSLHEIGSVKLGSFKLKSGVTSPIYIDLRLLPSHPNVLKKVSQLMWERIQDQPAIFPETFDPQNPVTLCGVPYTALPIATTIAVDHNVPMLIVRKERKDYGTKNMVEGIVEKNKTKCVILEDVVSSGSSVLATAKSLEEEDIIVKYGVVFLDREQGGHGILAKNGYELRSVLGIKKLLEILRKKDRVTEEVYQTSVKFLDATQFVDVPSSFSQTNAVTKKKSLTFLERSKLSNAPMGQKLFQLMETKKSNLALAADVLTTKELLALADEIGPEICMLKTHVDIITDFNENFVKELTQLAKKHNFLIFEDRKFADIGNVVKQQYSGGVYKISEWADISNSHVVSGGSSIVSLREAAQKSNITTTDARGFLLIAQMSTEDANTNQSTVETSLKVARSCNDFVFGFICQENIGTSAEDDGFIYCSPGVHLQKEGDQKGQHYNSPEHIIVAKGSDVIIVGRGICEAPNRLEEAKRYRKAGWEAYEKRISNQ